MSNLILNRQRSVAANVSAALERLSSGYRINHAADDAAGLAISERLRSRVAGLGQANRNIQDGISVLQTAEGGLEETQLILQRMRVLAVQAANDINTNDDRSYIQLEVDQLLSEVNRMSTSVQFNTMKLLSGLFEARPAGTTTRTTTVANTESFTMAEDLKNISNNGGGDNENNGSYSADGQWIAHSTSFGFGGIVIRRADGTGAPITVLAGFFADNVEFSPTDNRIVFAGPFDEIYTIDASTSIASGAPGINLTQLTFGAGIVAEPTWSPDGSTIAFSSNQTGNWRIHTVASGGGPTTQLTNGPGIESAPEYTLDGSRIAFRRDVGGGGDIYSVDATTGLGEQRLTFSGAPGIANGCPDFSSDGKKMFFSKVNAAGIEVYMINANGTGAESKVTAYGNPGSGPYYPEVSPDNSRFVYWDTVGVTTDIYTAATRYRLDISGRGIDTSNMTIRNTTTGATIANDAVNGWTLEGNIIIFNGGSVPGANDRIDISYQTTTTVTETVEASDGLVLHTGPEANQTLALSIPEVSTHALNLDGLSVATRTGAETAISRLDSAISAISSTRASIGAQQNRLEHAFNFNSIAQENEQSAESRIRDTDMAKEMIALTRNQILSQASSWALQAARMNRDAILQLLR